MYPYLLRGITSSYPNHMWGIDITYIRLRSSWMDLEAVLDWFSRYIVSWELDDTLPLSFVLTAVKRALAQARPVIWNSDQGSHFTRPQYREWLLAADVQISMDGKGRVLDNVFVERLWRSVKYEEVYPKEYASPWEARRSLTGYLAFYNHERPHQALAYRTPGEVYAQAIREDGYGTMAHTSEPPVIDQWATAWSSHDMDHVLALFTDDCIYEDVASGLVNHGKEELRAFGQGFYDFSPDLRIEVTAQSFSGLVAHAEWVFSGTQQAEFMGRPATGKRWSVRGASGFEMLDGKIQRCSDYWDVTTLLNQLD